MHIVVRYATLVLGQLFVSVGCAINLCRFYYISWCRSGPSRRPKSERLSLKTFNSSRTVRRGTYTRPLSKPLKFFFVLPCAIPLIIHPQTRMLGAFLFILLISGLSTNHVNARPTHTKSDNERNNYTASKWNLANPTGGQGGDFNDPDSGRGSKKRPGPPPI
ncbi:hypothetical protein O181_005553 [Austropuccinia psidii MF-1]|uniref:Uncharacterized protein n=1 Tax=Austropuccinia psidii MF-1 TaxID=1389203 RepID=A0A9Q3BIR2_9BASI|nr:hypothetical protein [Austropuccinia psidii MF-1]